LILESNQNRLVFVENTYKVLVEKPGGHLEGQERDGMAVSKWLLRRWIGDCDLHWTSWDSYPRTGFFISSAEISVSISRESVSCYLIINGLLITKQKTIFLGMQTGVVRIYSCYLVLTA